MKRALSILALLFAFVFCVSAQSKQEIKWYNKTITSGTVAAYDIFLKRYPKSVFRHEIDSLRYEALYVTHMDNQEALDIFSDLKPSLKPDQNKGEFFRASAIRDNGRDFIVGVSVREEDLPFEMVRVYLSEKKAGIWQMPTFVDVPKPVAEQNKFVSFLNGDENIVTIDGGKWLHFAFRSYSKDGERIEHVETLMPVGEYAFDNQTPGFVSEIFAGNRLSGKRIEGMMPVFESGGDFSNPELFLLNRLKEDESLVEISRENYLSDQAISWWIENNPAAQTSAQSIKFGILPEECSIVKAYLANREKEKGEGWTAALFDIRGYSVVCARNSAGSYLLVWCEPRIKDRATDRLLNTIYFDKGSTLALFYYQGRKAFKYKLNLSSKNITR